MTVADEATHRAWRACEGLPDSQKCGYGLNSEDDVFEERRRRWCSAERQAYLRRRGDVWKKIEWGCRHKCQRKLWDGDLQRLDDGRIIFEVMVRNDVLAA
jgi:hypothetical protein